MPFLRGLCGFSEQKEKPGMEATTKLTAYNQDVQRYIEKGSPEAKREIIKTIKEESLKNGINFNRLFPSGSKRMKVLDEIIYMLSNGGICKIASETLANNTGASVRTVNDAVKGIKELGMFIVAGLADGKNKYVFVYKKHADFKGILANVFYLNAEQIAEQIAEQKKAETVDTKGVEGRNTSSNSINSSIIKQEKDILRESIENDIKETDLKEYTDNEYQLKLYETIKSSIYDERIKKDASIICLRAGSNLDESFYNKALITVAKIDKHLTLGGDIKESIPALFDKIYLDRILYKDYYKTESPKKIRNTSYLYNWLEN